MNVTERIRAFALLAALVLVGSFAASAFPHRPKTPKNVIIMIGDGMGFAHIDAASLYQFGATGRQVYEQFPVRLAMRTSSAGIEYDPMWAWKYFNYVTRVATDSGAAATAMACGIRTYNGAIGVDLDKRPVRNLLERAEEVGKSTGVVTSVPFADATPAGFVAHNEARSNHETIVRYMVYESAAEVIMGCGHPLFTDNGERGFTKKGGGGYEYRYVGGENTWEDMKDGLVVGSDANGDGMIDARDVWKVIHTKEEFQSLAADAIAPYRLIGIPEVFSTLQQSRQGETMVAPYEVPRLQTVPTLAEMALGALNILGKNPNGLFLMIEGGAIDWAGHGNQPGRMIEEVVDFNGAIEAVVGWIEKHSNWNETLLIVTADHETGYLTGPGSGATPQGPVWNALGNNGAGKMPEMQWNSKGHTNSLVPFFAKGRGSSEFAAAARGAGQIDPRRGWYINNTDIAQIIFRLWK